MNQIRVLNQGVSEETLTPYLSELQQLDIQATVVEKPRLSELTQHQGVLLVASKEQTAWLCSWIFSLREQSRCSIWVYQPQATSEERVLYLKLGAEGIFLLDHPPAEVSWWIKNALERKGRTKERGVAKERTSVPLAEDSLNLVLDDKSLRVMIGHRYISLTKTEYHLLALLYEKQGEAYSYEEIYSAVWKERYVSSKQYKVANVVFHLRLKLKDHQFNPAMIQTIRSVGYRLLTMEEIENKG